MGEVINTAVKWARDIAADNSHGYDQSFRWGPNYDCSSLVISAYEYAGTGVKTAGATYTGNMRSVFLRCGFIDVTSQINLSTGAELQPGDVLLQEQYHTAMYIGAGRLVHAAGNENGGATGGKTGDQTGKEICEQNYFNYNPGGWNCVLRYVEDTPDPSPAPDPTPTPVPTDTYIVQQGDTLWGIAERFLGSGLKYPEIMAANGLKSSLIYVGQVLRIPGSSDRKTLTVTVSAETYAALQAASVSQNKSIGEIIDERFSKPTDS